MSHVTRDFVLHDMEIGAKTTVETDLNGVQSSVQILFFSLSNMTARHLHRSKFLSCNATTQHLN